jgi:hypothetical protein
VSWVEFPDVERCDDRDGGHCSQGSMAGAAAEGGAERVRERRGKRTGGDQKLDVVAGRMAAGGWGAGFESLQTGRHRRGSREALSWSREARLLLRMGGDDGKDWRTTMRRPCRSQLQLQLSLRTAPVLVCAGDVRLQGLIDYWSLS